MGKQSHYRTSSFLCPDNSRVISQALLEGHLEAHLAEEPNSGPRGLRLKSNLTGVPVQERTGGMDWLLFRNICLLIDPVLFSFLKLIWQLASYSLIIQLFTLLNTLKYLNKLEAILLQIFVLFHIVLDINKQSRMAVSWEFPLSKTIQIKIHLSDKGRIFNNWSIVDLY